MKYVLIGLIAGIALGFIGAAQLFTFGSKEVVYITKEQPRTTATTPYWDRPENQAEKQRIGREHEEARLLWLAENPPVEELFNVAMMYNTEYVIQYLRENKIAGHCALIWRPDVVCADFGSLRFPTSRDGQY